MKFEPVKNDDKLVPLDSLMPLPAWYRDKNGDHYAHDDQRGCTIVSADHSSMYGTGAHRIRVYPQRYRMVGE